MSTSTVHNLNASALARRSRVGRSSFWLGELSGSLGDLGTFLPLALTLAITTDLDFAAVFIWAGAANLLAGWCFRLPIPVQPMKALAAVAITQHLSRGEIAAAGLFVALVLIVLAGAGILDRITGWIPKPLIRAVQIGIGVRLMLKGVEWLTGFQWAGLTISLGTALPWIGHDSLVVALLAAGLLTLPWLKRYHMLVPVFVGGLALAALAVPQAHIVSGFDWPRLTPAWPAVHEWKQGLLQAGLPQLPLTLMNSVVAVCALSGDLFPRSGVRPARMAWQVGLINLVSLPFGAMPMCHGAGGLAAQHRFGARTGASSLMLGAIMIATALLFGTAAGEVLMYYPKSILAVMLILAGWALAGVVRDCLKPANLVILFPTVVLILVFHAAVGFLVGAAIAGILVLKSQRVARQTARKASTIGELSP